MTYYTRVRLLNDFIAGESAFTLGAKPSACPHTPTDSESAFSAYYWLAGWWMAARPGVDGVWREHISKVHDVAFWASLASDLGCNGSGDI